MAQPERFQPIPLATVALLCCLLLFVSVSTHAQTLTVLHNFTGGADGLDPATTLVLDRGGNLYGTSLNGENGYGGVVFKLTHRGSSWTFDTLHNFVRTEGVNPVGVTLGPDGNLYGANSGGGGTGCGVAGCGTIFKLTPPARFCGSVDCVWPATILSTLTGATGDQPLAPPTFDQAGSLYGTTAYGGSSNWGLVYELSSTRGSWTYSPIYSFGQLGNGYIPYSGVVFDAAGNLYGTTIIGGAFNLGAIYEMTPSGSGWTEKLLYSFPGGPAGMEPIGGLAIDSAGNLYGTTWRGGEGSNCTPGCGTVFQLSYADGGWNLTTLYSFTNAYGDAQPEGSLTMDAAGNLYGTTTGYNSPGNVFKLTRTSGVWTYTSLHQFGPDGVNPYSAVTVDASGNLYGTASSGGTHGFGTAWEITP